MRRANYRFLAYGVIGLFFGILDWFYLNWLGHVSWRNMGDSNFVVPIIIFMNYGIWLVAIIPVCLHEARTAGKLMSTISAGVITWSCAILSYYLYYGLLLSLGKLPHLAHLNIFGEKYDAFWNEWWQMFKGIIVEQFFEWIFIAIIGGAVIGAISYHVIRKWSRVKNSMQM